LARASRGRPLLFFILLPHAAVAAPARAIAMCPSESEIKGSLGIEGPLWQVTCHEAEDRTLQLAALLPPNEPDIAPRLIVSTSGGSSPHRGEVDLPEIALDGRQATLADDWTIVVGPARVERADWLQVTVTAKRAGDLATARTIVSFFLDDRGELRPMWTGLADNHEARLGACSLDTAASFSLSDDGALVRTLRTSRTFRDPGGIASGLAENRERQCVAPRPRNDTFAVADDGIASDLPVTDALRSRARQNRRLYLRAHRSPKDLSRFVADSLGLIPLLRDEVMAPHSPSAGVDEWAVTTSGAFALMTPEYGESGLNWKNLRSVTRREGRALVSALGDLGGARGAWSVSTSDFGGCHKPEAAEAVLRRLVDAWNATPGPLRDAFKRYLAGRLRDMTRDACFCEPGDKRDKIQRALDRNATILEELPAIGPDVARELRALPSTKDARFGCGGGG